MKKIVIIISLLFLNGCIMNKEIRKPAFKYFQIKIEQNGLVKNIKNNEVFLSKNNFTIRVELLKEDNIFINASYNPETYISSLEGKDINSIKGFHGTGIADSLFNKDKYLIINDNAPNFWHYTNKNDHRFSNVVHMNNKIICRREISQIMNLNNEERSVTEIKNLDQKIVYLVIIKAEWNQSFDSRIEMKRYNLKLIFNDNLKTNI